MRYEGVVDMFQTVKILRAQRPSMVQNEVGELACDDVIYGGCKRDVYIERDSEVVSSSNSQSGGTGFDSRQRPTCPGLTKPSILLRSVNWYQLRLGVKSPLYGHGVVSVGLLLAPFHSSFCSWSVCCKAGSGHFRCKSRYRKTGTLNFLNFIALYTT